MWGPALAGELYLRSDTRIGCSLRRAPPGSPVPHDKGKAKERDNVLSAQTASLPTNELANPTFQSRRGGTGHRVLACRGKRKKERTVELDRVNGARST